MWHSSSTIFNKMVLKYVFCRYVQHCMYIAWAGSSHNAKQLIESNQRFFYTSVLIYIVISDKLEPIQQFAAVSYALFEYNDSHSLFRAFYPRI